MTIDVPADVPASSVSKPCEGFKRLLFLDFAIGPAETRSNIGHLIGAGAVEAVAER